MAEVIAVGASVIAIIQITDRIIGLCKFYGETLNDVPRDLRIISVEITALKGVVQILQHPGDLDGSNEKPNTEFEGLAGLLQRCHQTVAQLERVFPSEHAKAVAGPANSKKRKLNAVKETLAWSFKAGKAQKLLDEMMRYKSSISLGLTAHSA